MSRAGARRIADRVGLLALGAAIVAILFTPITNNDLFLHLTTGRIVLETLAVPVVDDYSAVARGRPFVAHEWLAGVLFHLVERAFSLDGLVVGKVLCGLALAALLHHTARVLGATPAVSLPLLLLATMLWSWRMHERPHVFTFLLGALFVALLARRRMRGGMLPLAMLVPLQVLWANLHGAFVLGPAIVALAAAGEMADGLLEREGRSQRRREVLRLAGLAGLLFLASAANPYGVALLAFPFTLSASDSVGTVLEWKPPFTSAFAETHLVTDYVLWLGLGATVWTTALALAVRRRRAPPGGTFGALLFAVFLALSLRANRNVADFAIVTFPSLAAAATALLPARRPILEALAFRAGLAAALIGIAASFALHGPRFIPGLRRESGFGIAGRIPVAAADFLERRGVRGNVFSNYTFGAYLVYRLYPDVRVTMDSRIDVYGDALHEEYRRALWDADTLRAILERVDAVALCVAWPMPGVFVARSLRHIGGFRLAYADENARVYLRDDDVAPHGPRREREPGI